MKHSDQINEITKALAKARLQFGTVRKDRTGQVGQAKYKYATLESVLDATGDALGSNGVALLQSVTWEVTGEGEERLAWCVVHTMLTHESGQWLRSESRALIEPELTRDGRRVLSPVQDLGKVSTYLRRYSLTAILGVTAEEDTDGARDRRKSERAEPSKPAPTKPTPKAEHDPSFEADRKAIAVRLKELGTDIGEVSSLLESMGRPRLSGMTAEQRKKAISWLATDAGRDKLHEHVERQAIQGEGDAP